ncbi:MAG: STAS domain-containing protein [Bdellovibrionota bacterium]
MTFHIFEHSERQGPVEGSDPITVHVQTCTSAKVGIDDGGWSDDLAQAGRRFDRLALDLSTVGYLNSAAISALIRLNQLRKPRICGVQPDIREKFRILRLDRVFKLYTDVQTAVDEKW